MDTQEIGKKLTELEATLRTSNEDVARLAGEVTALQGQVSALQMQLAEALASGQAGGSLG